MSGKSSKESHSGKLKQFMLTDPLQPKGKYLKLSILLNHVELSIRMKKMLEMPLP